MPPKMVTWLQHRVAMDREFTSVSDYIRELVINDRERLKVKSEMRAEDGVEIDTRIDLHQTAAVSTACEW
jgi:Arc/MetJ-type ribon-helix-helix transcriptional regulator